VRARDENGRDRDDEDDPVHDQGIELVARMEEISVSKLHTHGTGRHRRAARTERRGMAVLSRGRGFRARVRARRGH
jgi:hypothetical protein